MLTHIPVFSLFFLYYIFALFDLVFCIIKMPFKVTGVIGKLLGLAGLLHVIFYDIIDSRGMWNQRATIGEKEEKKKEQTENRTFGKYGGITKVRNMIGRQEVHSSASINFLMADRLRVAVHRHTSGQQRRALLWPLSRRLVKWHSVSPLKQKEVDAIDIGTLLLLLRLFMSPFLKLSSACWVLWSDNLRSLVQRVRVRVDFLLLLACTHIDTRPRFLKTSKPAGCFKKRKIVKTSWEKNLHNPKHKSYSSWEIVDAYIYKLQASKELRQPTTIGQVFFFYLFIPFTPHHFFFPFLSFHPPWTFSA